MVEKIANWLTRKPKLVAFIAVLLLIPSAIGYISTRINYDILSYLLEDPFKMAATSMLVVEDMPAGYTNSLINEIKEIPGVSNAIWISNLMGVQIPTDMIPANFRDMFFSGDATMMIIQYDHPGASDETMEAIEQVRKACNEKCFLAGFSVVIKDTRDLMDSELPMFVGLAVLMALCAMLLTLESTVLPFIFLASIGLAVIYNMGTNIFLGEISYITKAIAAVLQLGVTMDYSIFLYHRYEEERPNYEDERDAMAQAVVAAFRSLSSSSVTTIAGFLALCVMRLTLGRDIGIVMAKGVVLGVATVILVLPSLVLIFDKQITKHKHKSLMPSFDKVNSFILRHNKAIMVLFILLFIPAYYAQSHAGIYYKLDESLPRDLPSIVSNEKLKNDFDMATAHFIVLRDDLNPAEMSDIENRMEEVKGVTSVVSYHKMLGTGIPDFFIPNEVKDMLKQGGYQLMMVNSSYSPATDAVSAQLDEMTAILKQYDENAMITGEGAMTKDLIEVADVDFKNVNVWSILAVLAIIAISFKSISIPALLVASIEAAIAINMGIPYFTGTQLPFIASIVIGTIQLGATVDYSILMTTRYHEERAFGRTPKEAAQQSLEHCSQSILTSGLTFFAATVGVAAISKMELLKSICLLISRGALISMVVILVMLPAALMLCDWIIRHTTLKWMVPESANAKKSEKE